MSALTDEMVRSNAAWPADPGFDGSLAGPPARHVAVVTCMDARIDPLKVLGLAIGDAHVMRNAGGVVTDDVIRSLAVSQRALGTTEVVVVHHTRCGMLTLDEPAFRAQLLADTGMTPPWAAEGFGDLEADVRQSVARICRNPFLPHVDEVRGYVYDVETGLLHEVQ